MAAWRISFAPAFMPGFLEQNKIHPATPIAIVAPTKKYAPDMAGRQGFCNKEILYISFAYRILRKLSLAAPKKILLKNELKSICSLNAA